MNQLFLRPFLQERKEVRGPKREIGHVVIVRLEVIRCLPVKIKGVLENDPRIRNVFFGDKGGIGRKDKSARSRLIVTMM